MTLDDPRQLAIAEVLEAVEDLLDRCEELGLDGRNEVVRLLAGVRGAFAQLAGEEEMFEGGT